MHSADIKYYNTKKPLKEPYNEVMIWSNKPYKL